MVAAAPAILTLQTLRILAQSDLICLPHPPRCRFSQDAVRLCESAGQDDPSDQVCPRQLGVLTWLEDGPVTQRAAAEAHYVAHWCCDVPAVRRIRPHGRKEPLHAARRRRQPGPVRVSDALLGDMHTRTRLAEYDLNPDYAYRAHVVIQAREEADVDPDLILKRVAEAGGAKYSVHQEAPQKLERPAPVGSAYKPIGRPDIAAMSAGAQRETAPPSASVGTTWKPKHNELQEIRAKAEQDQEKEKGKAKAASSPAPPPVPAAARPTVSLGWTCRYCAELNIGMGRQAAYSGCTCQLVQ